MEQEPFEVTTKPTLTDTIDEIVDKVFGVGGVIYKYKTDYVERPEQIIAIKKAMNCLLTGSHFLMEAPCGFGKTFVYLFAAMIHALYYNKTAIVATNGITLQGQIYHKDAPLIAKIAEDIVHRPVRIVYMKGRQNYLCLRKKAETVANNFEGVQLSFTQNKYEMSSIMTWSEKTMTGDMAELSFKPSHEIWQNFSCGESDDCMGKACDHRLNCFYSRAKKACQFADIIITNYHLLFADIETGGQVLPEYDILVGDEAHNIADVSRNFQEQKVSYYTFLSIQKTFTMLERKYKYIFDSTRTGIKELVQDAAGYFKYVTITVPVPASKTCPLEVKLTPLPLSFDFKVFVNNLIAYREEICPSVSLVEYEEPDPNYAIVAGYLDRVIDKSKQAIKNLEAICTQSEPNQAYYVQLENNEMLSLRSKPVKVADYMRRHFFARNAQPDKPMGDLTTILTSATLAASNSFDYMRAELGIPAADQLIANSTFDLTKQQLWYLPKNVLDASDKDFLGNMLDNFTELVKVCGGGVLGLFTSIYNMRAASLRLRQETNFRVFTQGDAPQDKLLKDFAADKDSVLCGTKSMFEGVDIAGDSLRCVFIDKLPFISPEDPVTKMLLKEDGSFWKYSMPSMIISLKQAVGRGVRTIDDKCVIAFGDGRIKTARYAKQVMGSFNYSKTVTRDLDEVARFLGKDNTIL